MQQRTVIGVFAILLMAAGLIMRQQDDEAFSGACLRVGVVMAILWFAYPQLQGVPRWLIAVIAIVAFLAMRWGPRLLLLALPICFVLWLLRPKVPTQRVRDRERGTR